jgi:hypothetical protein
MCLLLFDMYAWAVAVEEVLIVFVPRYLLLKMAIILNKKKK